MTGDLPERIGAYEILSRLGAGGMGEVFLAQQSEPVQRRVALKVVRGAAPTDQVLARFEQERQALARMNHECIAQVYDAGRTDEGQPFFVMELVEGSPLDEFCRNRELTIDQRIELMRRVCEGVQHAHSKGVIHRDLKPGNILVVDRPEAPLPKIIDFGLARATDDQLSGQALFTEQGRLVGTPEYMSPEQARGESLAIDTRTDVYSLGVILYQLLCGELPFSPEELRADGGLKIRQILSEQDPKRPSTRVTTVRTLSRRLSGDLDWIALRALAKEPERRYETPSALANDLRRHLDGEPVEAVPQSFGYRFQKFVRRHRLQVASAGLAIAMLIVGVVVSVDLAARTSQSEVEAKKRERTAQREAERADNLARRASELAREADRNATLAAERREALDAEKKRFDLLSGVVLMTRAESTFMELRPAWPGTMSKIREWLDGDVESLKQLRPRVLEALEAMSASSATGSDDTDEALQSALEGLVSDTDALLRDQVREARKRLRWGTPLEQLSYDHPKARVGWDEALAAILDPDGETTSTAYRRYFTGPRRLQLSRQMGLVPIGPNPVTKLWEFYHLRSAWDGEQDPAEIEIPKHDADGNIAVRPETGIVFVLLPGGSFKMGAQQEDPSGQAFDPRARRDEGPVHEIELWPFFMARHEITQGQWRRLTCFDLPEAPSYYGPREDSDILGWTNPVERVSWTQADRILTDHRLHLPTEAQWEYACRAGADTVFSTGEEPDSLDGYANIRDRAALALSPSWGPIDVTFNDGILRHAPVGYFKANAFGLHDMHGNVSEWCLERYAGYETPVRERTGERYFYRETDPRMFRGGDYSDASVAARASRRAKAVASTRQASIGLRATRRLLR